MDPSQRELVKQAKMPPIFSLKNVLGKKSVPLMYPRRSLEHQNAVVLLGGSPSKLFARFSLEILGLFLFYLWCCFFIFSRLGQLCFSFALT